MVLGTFIIFLHFFHLFQTTFGAIVNRTIDDTFGDNETRELPRYLPNRNRWNDADCSGCSLRPDTDEAFRNTFMESTYSPSTGPVGIELRFEGIAIYIFLILANFGGDGITTITDCDFILDRGEPVAFTRAPDLTRTDFDYNVLAFSRTNLPNANHTLLIEIGDRVNNNAYINFDYAIYTHDDDPIPPRPSSPTRPSTSASGTLRPGSSPSASVNPGNSTSDAQSISLGAIVGGVVGGLATLVLVIVFFIYFLRRRRRASPPPQDNAPMAELEAHPFQVDPGTPLLPQDPSQRRPNANELQRIRNVVMSYHPGQGYSADYGPSSVEPASTADGSVYSSPYGGFASTTYSTSQSHIAGNNDLQGPNSSLTTAASGAPVLSSKQLMIRRARQEELAVQLRTAEEEMRSLNQDLQGGVSKRRSRQPSVRAGASQEEEEVEMSMSEMREQMKIMQRQIVSLRQNQRSEWAEGLTDDPPPGYTPSTLSTSALSRQTLPPLPPDAHRTD
ncbi:hypothetical protein FA15DRAFT_495642 [Coprinopsis marcescibilis]|uniref:Uncharacterized protein n=1 Tax=Coprinopsis marcescibilis TaxID=230819 RepID=A0A5C3KRD9_COPMA|nr:hypothetical protein FA15DRAFT_495642 [Coprinopsis marcescibilis]